MAANLTKDRATNKKATTAYRDQNVVLALAATTYYIGLMKCADAAGRGVDPGAAVAALPGVAGVVKDRIDNSLGANDAKSVELETGVFEFDLDGATPPTAANLFEPVYASSNHEISIDPAAGPKAGTLTAIYAATCDVDIDPTK